MGSTSVGEFLEEKKQDLQLSLCAGNNGLSRPIKVSEVNRPGLVMTGFFEHFPAERIQIIGLGEHTYLASLDSDQQHKIVRRMLSYPNLPCCIVSRNLDPVLSLIAVSNELNIPLLRTPLMTSQLMAGLIHGLENMLAPSTKVHGVLVRVYGLGVLILGEAGIGKSECALELLKRDHMVVADDVVEISKRSGGQLVGCGEDMIKHHMEIRGLGIINVQSLFGIGYTLEETNIEMVIRLTEWKKDIEYERVGIEDHTTDILGVPVPEIVLPVGPGRNLAILVEIASLNQRLKSQGHHSAKELNERLLLKMEKRD